MIPLNLEWSTMLKFIKLIYWGCMKT